MSLQIVFSRAGNITEFAFVMQIFVGVFMSHERIFVLVPKRTLAALERSVRVMQSKMRIKAFFGAESQIASLASVLSL